MTWTRREFISTCACAAASCAFPGCTTHPQKPEILTTPAAILPPVPQIGHYFYNQFGITQAMIDQVLAKSLYRGGDWGELYFEHTSDHKIILQNGKIQTCLASQTLGMGVRCVVGDRFGYSYTESLALEDMLKAAETAAYLAPGVNATPIQPRTPVQYPKYYRADDDLNLIEIAKVTAWLRDVETRTLSKNSDVVQAKVTFMWSQRNIMIHTSDGFAAEDFIPYYHFGVAVFMQRQKQMEIGFHFIAGRTNLEDITSEQIENTITQAIENANHRFDAISVKPGEYPAVLASDKAGVMLHECIGHGLEGDLTRQGISLYSDRLGQRIAPPEVTIIDDGCIPFNSGALNIDDEGTPAQRTTLVENGILTGFMHDKISAKYYGVAPTGNGRRMSYKFPPIPRMRTTMMQNGTHEIEELFEGISYGVYCQEINIGSVNIGNGDYTFYVPKGRLIENGKLTAPVKDFNIIGNGPDSLQKIDRIANDFTILSPAGECGKNNQHVRVSFGTPSFRIPSITIGGK